MFNFSRVKILQYFIIFLSITSVLPLHTASAQSDNQLDLTSIQAPQTVGDAKVLALEILGRIPFNFQDAFQQGLVVWKKMLNEGQRFWDNYVFPKMGQWFEKNISPKLQEEINKIKQRILEQIKQEGPVVGKSLWEKFKEILNWTRTPGDGEKTPPYEFEVPILVLKYFPLQNDKLDPAITGINNMDLAAIKSKVDKTTNEIVNVLNEGTAYHKYKESGAIPSLGYAIYEQKEFLAPVPETDGYPTAIPKNADKKKIFSDINVCDYIDNKGVKEVWIWMYHTDRVAPIESNMAMGTNIKKYWPWAAYGDASNSYRINDLPICQKTYTVFEYNYSRGTSEALEDHIHQIEALFGYLDPNLFWNLFAMPYKTTADYNNETHSCGWAHYPPNGRQDYDWQNTQSVWSDCEDWKPDHSGEKQYFNCDKWGCNSVQYFKWWMQNIPGKNNNLTYNGKLLRNWWDFLGDFDAAVQVSKRLTY